jgi:hypothetical protein
VIFVARIVINISHDGVVSYQSQSGSSVAAPSGGAITQAFHLLPEKRSQPIPARDIDVSFDAITRHELMERRVIALGTAAVNACCRHGIECRPVVHPSARGLSRHSKAANLARALTVSLGT